ncbi:MAG: translocation/assembly module TamB domain-containing protein [Myxococcota bacterium]
MGRRALIAIAILGGALAGIIVGLKSPRVADNLVRRLQQAAQEHWGIRLEIDDLKLELMPPAIAVEGVRAYKSQEHLPWCALHRGKIVLRPWPSTTGALVVQYLDLDGLKGSLELGQTEGIDAPKSSSLRIDVRQLFVWNANLEFTSPQGQLALRKVDLSMQPDDDGGRRIEIDLPDAVAYIDEREIPFEASVRANLLGSTDHYDGLKLEESRFFFEQIKLNATGSIDTRRKGMDVALTLNGNASLAHLHSMIPQTPEMAGDAEIKLEINADPTNLMAPPLVRAAIDIHNAELLGQRLGEVSVGGLYSGETLELDSFRVSEGNLGTVTGSGTIHLSEKLPIDLRARLHRVSLPEVLEKTGLQGAWVKLLYSADVQGKGELHPFSLNLETDGRVENFSVLDKSYLLRDANTIFGIQEATLRGRVHISEQATYIHGVEIGLAKSSLAVSGFLSHDTSIGLDLRAASDHIVLDELGPIGDVPFAGSGTLAAAIEGPYENITVSGTAEINSLGVLGYPVGDTQATLIYNGVKIAIDRAKARRGNGWVTGTGWIDFGADLPHVGGAFLLKNASMSELMRTAGTPAALAQRFEAEVTGRFVVNGPLPIPDGTLSGKAPELKFDGVSLGPFTAEGGFGQEMPLWGDLQTSPGGGLLQADIRARQPDPNGPPLLDLQITSKALPIVAIAPLIGGADLQGLLTANANLKGYPGHFNGQINGHAENFQFYGLNLDRFTAVGEADDGVLALNGHLMQDRAEYHAKIDMGWQLPFSITARGKDLDLNRTRELPLQIKTTGSVFSQGDLTLPETITAQIEIIDASVASDDIVLRPTRPARIVYYDNLFELVDLDLAGSGLHAYAEGTIPLEGDMAMELMVNGDLSLADSHVSGLHSIRGPLELDLKIGGPRTAPLMSGSGKIERGSAAIHGTDIILEDLRADLIFAGRNIDLRGGRAQAGGGTLRFNGAISLPENTEDDALINLRSRFDSVTSHPNANLSLTASGNLALEGRTGDLALKGSVHLDHLRFSRDLQLDIHSFLPRRGAPLRVPTFAPGESVALSVAINAEDNVWVTGSQLEAELAVDVAMTGTSDRIGLQGTITPKKGAIARNNGIEFNVERASIDFTEEYRIVARYEAYAQAKACKMDISLHVYGSSDDNPTIEARGRDENGEVDPRTVLPCLYSGFRASEQTASHTTGLEDTLSTAISGLWAVSGLSQQMRRVLPIDEVNLTSSRSERTKRPTLRVIVSTELGPKLELKYNVAPYETNDQILGLEYRLSKLATVEGSWTSVSEVLFDLGADLRLRWEFE